MTDILSRGAASDAVNESAWRYLLGTLRSSVPVISMAQGVEVAGAAVAACAEDADDHLNVDLRPDRVELGLQTFALDAVTQLDVDLSRRITDAVTGLGLTLAGVTSTESRSVQMLEIAIDAMDIAAIRPFWKAVLNYEDQPSNVETPNGIVDPARQGPAFWFQQMDEPRPQRNRIHFDITVSHEEADARIAAGLAAGGTMVSDAEARAFWILADCEGNEICVCTWQDRD
jgi:4a-hydroxytetrahydrobiopterin dehydratase